MSGGDVTGPFGGEPGAKRSMGETAAKVERVATVRGRSRSELFMS